ncbi:MAG TPA: hypothetical protein VFR97_11705 [Capillimicrobium sp.]|nr:hypothetical protein [Capillimicrobium sp.]
MTRAAPSSPAVLLALLVAALLASTSGRAVAAPFHGVGVTTLFASDGTLVPGGAGHLDEVAAAGIPLARMDAAWPAVQPFGPGDWRWVTTDRIAGALAARGIRWLPVLGYATSWSTTVGGTDKAAPADPAAFAAYAAAVAQRYGPGGAFWAAHPELPALPVDAVEIWNEPNIPAYWRPSPDPAAYATLYRAARDAVHAAAPGVAALVGGLSPYGDPTGFLRAMHAARPDLAGRLDGVALHPYSPTPAGVVAIVADVRATLTELGAGSVPISVTELGWPRPNQSPTASFALPDDTRAGSIAFVADALAASDCDVDRLALFTWATPMRDPVEQEDWFGLTGFDGTRTPAAQALSDAAAGAPPRGPLPICGPGRAAPAPPLPLGLTAWLAGGAGPEPGGDRCVAARVTYRDLPVRGIEVRFQRPGDTAVSRLTDDRGEAVRCLAPAREPVRVWASAGGGAWASSTLTAVAVR